MIILTTVSEKYFNLNGIQYAKIYQPLAQGIEDIGIYNIYDTRQQLQNSEKYDQYQVDTIVYGNQADAIAAILDVVYQAPSSGVIVIQFGVVTLLIFKHQDNDQTNNFVEHKDIVMGYWGKDFYKLRFDINKGIDTEDINNYDIIEKNNLPA